MGEVVDHKVFTGGVTETPPETKEVFASGAQRSKKMPRFDLVPREALECLADRLAMGAAKYGDWNWQKGLDDPEWMRDSLNHIQGHLSNIMRSDFSEDDEWGNLGGILFGAMMRAVALKKKAKAV